MKQLTEWQAVAGVVGVVLFPASEKSNSGDPKGVQIVMFIAYVGHVRHVGLAVRHVRNVRNVRHGGVNLSGFCSCRRNSPSSRGPT